MPTTETNDIETYYERRGEGPPVVFIHGAIMDHRMWDAQLDALADEYTVVAYDVRGHGRTGGSDASTYTPDLLADDLDALLTALDLDRPVLCGLSMGGCIAQAYAARHPDRIAGLVLADTFTQAPLGVTGRLLFANLRFFATLDRVVRYKALNRFQTWVGERIKPGVAGDGVTVQQLIDEGETISHAEFAKIIDFLVSFPTGDLDLSHVEVPTLVLYGENEPSLMHQHAALLGERIPGTIAVTEIPDSGHASNIDNPAFFTDAVRDLLAQVSWDATDAEADEHRVTEIP